jgi:hypothetical protein
MDGLLKTKGLGARWDALRVRSWRVVFGIGRGDRGPSRSCVVVRRVNFVVR